MYRYLTTVLAGAALLGAAITTQAAIPGDAILYKNPDCGCCDDYARHLEQKGIDVTIIDDANMGQIKQQARLPYGLGSCHTMKIGDYHVEGHVPYAALVELFEQQPDIHGITLPGMPQGTPGMPGPQLAPYEIQQFTDREAAPFMSL